MKKEFQFYLILQIQNNTNIKDKNLELFNINSHKIPLTHLILLYINVLMITLI